MCPVKIKACLMCQAQKASKGMLDSQDQLDPRVTPDPQDIKALQD